MFQITIVSRGAELSPMIKIEIAFIKKKQFLGNTC